MTDRRRSALMARVRQKGTDAELVVAEVLTGLNRRYRKNVRSLPGSPDFANKSRRWAIFVNGCFWHHHTACRRATLPKSNGEFWREKLNNNRRRDAKAIRKLRASGYRVVVAWECETTDRATLSTRLSKILETGRIDMGQTLDHGGVVVDVSGPWSGRGGDEFDGTAVVRAIDDDDR